MAFTLAHVAAVLPFYRYGRCINFEALIIGSMLPDLPYVLSSNVALSQQSHQLLGLFTYCLPVGLLVFLLWYALLKQPALSLIQPCHPPHGLIMQAVQHSDQASNGSVKFSPVKFSQAVVLLITVSLGLVLGASTHLVWDGITHPDGLIARQLDWLQQPLHLSQLGPIPVARLLQYATSVLGVLWVGLFARRQLLQPAAITRPRPKAAIGLKRWHRLLIVALLGGCSLLTGLQAGIAAQNLWFGNHYLYMAKVMVGVLQGLLGAFVSYALLYQGLYWFCYFAKRTRA